MLREIEGLTDAIGIEAIGTITAAERKSVLEPSLASALEHGDRIKLLYVAGPGFAGYEGGAAFDEAVFGTRHFTDFEKIAFVSDAGPHDRAVGALEGLIPAALRRFRTGDIDRAKAWLAE